jgi:hypothetical protein
MVSFYWVWEFVVRLFRSIPALSNRMTSPRIASASVTAGSEFVEGGGEVLQVEQWR